MPISYFGRTSYLLYTWTWYGENMEETRLKPLLKMRNVSWEIIFVIDWYQLPSATN